MTGNVFTVFMILFMIASLGGGSFFIWRFLKDGNRKAAIGSLVGTVVAMMIFASLSSMRLVGNQVGIITKHAMGRATIVALPFYLEK